MIKTRFPLAVLLCFATSLVAVYGDETDTKSTPATSDTPAEVKDGGAQNAEANESEAKESDADATDAKDADANEVLAGHSYHGEAFNEGPRQQAYLMDGCDRVQFPVTSSDPIAEKFVQQGVAQLHGFWYFEAERSFRQAAAIDPDCAIAYWGMAMANTGNQKRAKEFIAEAVERKDEASRREQLYIEALDAYMKADPKKRKERAEAYTKALENMLYEFPDDIEAKAFLALQLWSNRRAGVPIGSHLAVDALMQQILAVEPLHPVHHYRIHLWDYQRAETALSSAARCGQALPAIAHMWHMPGHIYSRVKRYNDAVWQQEASARIDHAHMMRDRVLPDQIHNFAHNNEWLIRNLNYVGRIRDAVDLAKNMIELPRHPKYNTLSKRGSSQYGRTRLFETLARYELWEETIRLCDTPYLEPTDSEAEQIKRLRHLGRAYLRTNQPQAGAVQLAELRKRLEEKTKSRDDAVAAAEKKAIEKAVDQNAITKAGEEAAQKAAAAGDDQAAADEARETAEKETREKQLAEKKKDLDKAKNDARRPFGSRIRQIEQAIAELEGLELAATIPDQDAGEDESEADGSDAEDTEAPTATEQWKKVYELFKKASVDTMLLAQTRLLAGETDKAIEDAEKYLKSHQNEVQPLAMMVELLWEADRREKAKESFEELRKLSGALELDSPVFDRLAPIATELGYPGDWRIELVVPDDVGDRPELDALGPFRWQPSPALDWTLETSDGVPLALKQFQGQPMVLIFYLGHGCLHCAEQLHAFAPKIEEFREAGFEVLAISTDPTEELKFSIEAYEGGDLPIPLLSNAGQDVFKAYRCYDDFEDQPLHGTFVIDGDGMVRWQDISYEPFMDPDFVLKEAQRLLAQDEPVSASGS